MIFFTTSAYSQNGGSKSSYSRFGLGLLNDQSQSWNRAMGGVGVALPSGSKLNNMNPASYAYLDSLSFILDAGMSGNFGQMTQNGNSKNVNSASFDYITFGFRLRKGIGMSVGFRPYSTIGYNYTSTSPEAYRDENTGAIIRNTTSYQGDGGLRQVFAGLGWKPFTNFAIGTNVSILWGGYTHAMLQSFTVGNSSSSSFDSFNFIQNASVLTYKLDFGAQYAFRVSTKDWLTLGAAVGLGHKFDGEAFLYRFMTTGDTLRVNGEKDGLDIPMTYAAGIAWQHKNNLVVSADAHYQEWGSCRIPTMVISDNEVTYPSTNKIYKNNFMLKAGVEYTPDPFAIGKYYKHIKYRMGVSYSSPYMNIPQGEGIKSTTHDGPCELGVSLGLGLPISNPYNSRSTVNIGFQWLRRSSAVSTLITENYLVLNLGITFNERWFMKYKIQ
ncbi:MAG: hypothetical protein K2J00_00265 [Bacteroidaceae bacterium]|nr:hypothetical protein [Bacteroidaceae bacterium]